MTKKEIQVHGGGGGVKLQMTKKKEIQVDGEGGGVSNYGQQERRRIQVEGGGSNCR